MVPTTADNGRHLTGYSDVSRAIFSNQARLAVGRVQAARRGTDKQESIAARSVREAAAFPFVPTEG